MSQINRNILIPFIACLLATLISACSSGSGGSGAIFNPEGSGGSGGGHPSGWLNRNSGNFHADAYLRDVGSCTECHGPALQGGIAQVGCYAANRGNVACHPGNDAPHMTPLLSTSGQALEANAILMCGKCHDLNNFQSDQKNQCQRCHADPNDPSDMLNGQLKEAYPAAYPFGFGSAQNVQNHSAAVVGTKYGPWESDCVNCHNPHAQEQNNTFGTNYGKLIKRSLTYFNNVTGETLEGLIEFTAPTGPGSFADGPPHDENICEVCHTRTNHHQRDGTAPGGQEHFSGQNCTQCHSQGGGFAFAFEGQGLALPPPHDTEPFFNNCDYCHVDDGAGNINFRAVVPNAKCNQCHGENGALKTDFPSAPNVLTHSGKACVECHNPMWEQENLALIRSTIASSVIPDSPIVFTAYTGDGSFADGPPHEQNICETCHSMTKYHQYDGTAPGGQSHFDGLDCTAVCHPHAEGIIAPTESVPNLHHLRVGTSIMPGSIVPNPDADSNGIPDTVYGCLTCHGLVLDPEGGEPVFVPNFRDCTACHK
ncbi:MAG: cytochrome c3 family protein [bacterium]|nr:cytochrome c3 family protein [bacterium]